LEKHNYKSIREVLKYFVALLALPFALTSQNVTVKGRAHTSYIGKIIQLYTLTDFMTNLKQKESQDTIQPDGFFELGMHCEFTQPVFIKIDNVTARLYVQPDFVYGITIPETDQNYDYKNDSEIPVNIGIVGADSTELNMLIFDYEEKFNNLFDMKNGKFLSRNNMMKRADSLKKWCDVKFAGIRNPYFKSYYDYSIASINVSLSRGEKYLINYYVLHRPIQYHHYEYMQFFNACFKGYLNSVASTRKGQSLYNIINTKASYDLLDKFMAEDQFMKNDSLRELVIIRNLWDFHYSSEFEPEAIRIIVSEIHLKTKIEEHKNICATMLSYFNKMQPGSPAPNFKARTKAGAIAELGSLKNRWIYLNFFSVENEASLREMAKIAALKKKMADKVTFVSVCLDDSLKSYSNFLKANPKYDWNIWYYADRRIEKTAKEIYSVSGTESYYLINNFGYLAQSPAPSPSKGIEFKLNSIFKTNRKNTKTGIR
jgi:hypothetical protein